MKFRNLLISVSLVLAIASCKKDNTVNNNGTGGSTGVTGSTGLTGTTGPTQPQAYTITETFEEGTKTAYADATVQLSIGNWDFNDALIGNLAADVKDGENSVRLRTGDIAMDFDISGLTQISIKHAKYGTDASSTWQLLQSVDGGATYTQVGSDITETSTTLVTDSFKITATTKVRFEIKKASWHYLIIKRKLT